MLCIVDNHIITCRSDVINMSGKPTAPSTTGVEICNLDKKIYGEAENWEEFLNAHNTLDSIPYDLSWIVMFSQLRKRNKYFQIINDLRDELKESKHVRIYPKPRYLYSAFLACPASELKVVFLGQDPYFKSEKDYDNGVWVPQAMGMSFSVADDFDVPSSLQNIYRNLINNEHIDEMPRTGNLWYWAVQGCLMLNTALTVKHDDKRSHSRMWQWMTDEIITYISTHFDDIIFVLWGGDAYKKINLIDQDKHHAIISSHPSGLSAHKSFRTFPAFNDFDHFGEINRILRESGKKEIIWN
jgi:uracil-DNA glycosylase